MIFINKNMLIIYSIFLYFLFSITKSTTSSIIENTKLRHIRQKRQAIGSNSIRWPRTIDYEIYFPGRENDILTAMKPWEDYSCLSFHEDASANPRIRFSEGPSESLMGMKPGEDGYHEVTFKEDSAIYTIMHELGHALGFDHTHQRKDRDEYLDVDESKISEKWKKAYEVEPESRHYDVPFDPASIMSYSGYDDGIQVMVTKDHRYKRALGQRMHPSFCDILMLNTYYDCEDICEEFETECQLGGGFPNPKDCEKCVCPSGFGGDSCKEPAGTCGSILEATENPKRFAESVGSHYQPSEYEFYPSHFYHATTYPQPFVQSFGNEDPPQFTQASTNSNIFTKLFGSDDPPQFYQSFRRRRKRHSLRYGGGIVECHWHIRALPGHSIKLTLISLTARCDRSCDYGFAELKIRKDMRPTGIRICCQEDLDMILESETNLVVISIYGDVQLEFKYHSYKNENSSSIIFSGEESKSIRSLKGKSIRTSQRDSKSIRSLLGNSTRSLWGSKSIRSLIGKSIQTSQKESKSIRILHGESIGTPGKSESIRPQRKSEWIPTIHKESIRPKGISKSIRLMQGESKSNRCLYEESIRSQHGVKKSIRN